MKKSRYLFTISVVAFIAIVSSIAINILIQKNRISCASQYPEPKSIAFSILSYQRAHHYEKSIFLSDFNSMKEDFKSLKELYREYEFSPYALFAEEEVSKRWNVSVKNYGKYSTVNILSKIKTPHSRQYIGVIGFNPSEKDYKMFMCSTTKINETLELHPIKISEDKLTFKCHPKTREDC